MRRGWVEKTVEVGRKNSITLMHRRFFERLKARFDPEDRVDLLLSSEDEELEQYLESVGALGSADMDLDGTISVKIHDAANATRACLLEECAHALQFMRDGSINLSTDSRERDLWELEVVECLDRRSHKFPQSERLHYARAYDQLRRAV